MMNSDSNKQQPARTVNTDRLLTLWRWLFRTTTTLLIVAAALLTTGRALMPLVAGYQPEIESQLGSMLGTGVEITDIHGDWYRFGPILDITELRILNPDNPAGGQVISHLFIKPDMLGSLVNRKLIIDQVIVEAPSFRLTQNAEGKWSLAGLVGGDSDSNYTDAVLDFLLSTGRLQIVEAGLNLQWADGRTLSLENIFIDLANAGHRHDARIQARVAGNASPFQLVAAINGDPRNRYTADLYMHATDTDLSDFVSVPGMDIQTLQFTGDLWLSLQNNQFYNARANVTALNLAGTGTAESALNAIRLDNASFLLGTRHDTAERWQVWLEDAEFDWFNTPWHTDEIYLDMKRAGESWPLLITASNIDLAMVNDVLDDVLSLSDLAETALNDLSPEGQLANAVISTDLAGGTDGGFLLQGNLRDVAVGAWQGAPAGAGIQGYVEANSYRGFVELDTADFTVFLPRLFSDQWHYDSANSRVNWQVGDGQIRVNSSVIDVSNDFLHGHVQFDLWNHRDSNGDLESELTLLIGLIEVNGAFKSLYLPNLPKIQTTMDWLDTGLLGGQVSNSGMVIRTSTLGNAPENSGTVLGFFNVNDATLKFLPDWPALNSIDAYVLQNNNTVDVVAESATIEGIDLGNTTATLRPDPAGGSWLTVQGNAITETRLGMAFLRNTPVRNNIGDFIDDWRGEGNIGVDINLGIPINMSNRQTEIAVNVVSNLSTLTIPEYALAIDELRGRVVYDNATGLSASALSGRLFDFPIAATIEPITETGADGSRVITGTRVVGSGRASRSALQAWEGQPQFVNDVLNFASGEIDYLAEISIPYTDAETGAPDNTSLRLSSELLGLSLDLPFPFRKTVENIRPLEVLIDFSDTGQWISARFDGRVGANLRIVGDRFAGGQVMLGPRVSEMTFGPVALGSELLGFSGSLDRFDYADWETTVDQFAERSTADAEIVRFEDILGPVDVMIGRLNVIGQDLVNVRTRVQRTGGLEEDSETSGAVNNSWQVNLENALLSGAFLFPDDESLPWQIDLDYLHFPESEEEENAEGEQEEIDVLADVDPATIPDLDFVTQELTVGDKDLGAWSFALRTNGNSATISDLEMTTPDARIRDLTGTAGANLDWRYDNGMHTSSFTGLFSAGDLAQVLPAWGYDANVESEEAVFVSNLQWTGSPAAFGLKKAVGNVELEINNGRFVDVDSGTSRLFGAFSFDSLVRRLQLDFSDLYEKGLAYDDISGSLEFNRGIVRTQGDLRIEAPSSRITINGEINLTNETIDADMLVNVPLGQNLSVLAGILGAWPIAVSTFLASKIFQDQMDEFTTVLYRLEGPWDNPASGFEPTEEILEEAEAAQAASEQADAPVSPPDSP